MLGIEIDAIYIYWIAMGADAYRPNAKQTNTDVTLNIMQLEYLLNLDDQ